MDAVTYLIGDIIIKYGELVNELLYDEKRKKFIPNGIIVALLRKIMEQLDATKFEHKRI